jgi:carboxylate-amine ligase
MSDPMEFKTSEALTLGVELELQLIDRRDGNLTAAATDLLRIAKQRRPDLDIKLEITESMIEVATHIQRDHQGVLNELRDLREVLCLSAEKLHIGICGGGTHPFAHWADRRIANTPRFHHVADLYGYLAKQFTVFGQHVHVGCPDGDAAMRLLHGLSRYVPHFIALSASSPFQNGVDTSFACSRMNTVASFPLSGRAPYALTWSEFIDYFERMRSFDIVQSMKDFYWDIRPKPEFGTVEVRVFDTPLTVQRATTLAMYTQSLARLLMQAPPFAISEDIYMVYSYNRFQACRFGLDGQVIDPFTRERRSLREDIGITLKMLRERVSLASAGSLLEDVAWLINTNNDSAWIRAEYQRDTAFDGLMFRQRKRFETG